MKFYIQKVVGSGSEGIEEAEENAETAFNKVPPTSMTTGQTFDSNSFDSNHGALLEFSVDQDSWISLYKIRIRTDGHYAIFCEHDPSEFVDSIEFSFIHEEDGHAVKAEYVGGTTTTTNDDKPWKLPLLATFLASLPSFIGIVLFSDFIFTHIAKSNFLPIVHAFTSSVLIATAAFLLLPEGLHLISADYTDEAESTAVWGTILSGGFLVAYLTQHLCGNFCHRYDDSKEVSNEMYSITNGNNTTTTTNNNSENKNFNPNGLSYLTILTSGDLICNFIDGLFIGTAFNCSNTFGWTVTAVTILHELPQEIGDFITLITIGGVTKSQALAINAVSGLCAVLGCVVYLYGNFSNALVGGLLVYGASNFIFCGLNEMPIIQFNRKIQDNENKDNNNNNNNNNDEIKQKNEEYTNLIDFMNLAAYSFGVILIGLVLLEHNHCDVSSSSSGGAHDGHGH